MKRKLNENGVPEETEARVLLDSENVSFTTFGLDPRILKGVQKQHFSKPTDVQSRVIPLALEGKDILARSGTGSGKTAAYVLPILHSILQRKSTHKVAKRTAALILVPTRELATQVTRTIESLSVGCGHDIHVVNIGRKEEDKVQQARLADSPDIVVSTPSRAAANLANSALSVSDLSHLIIDEADLVLSYGYEDDLRSISAIVPRGVQTLLMSATLDTGTEQLKTLFCSNPSVIELDDASKKVNQVNQYVVKCAEDEKFLIFYAIFMLKLIKGKSIVFIGDIDRCYRLKLFLEQFGIRSCVLNSELPVNSRIHVVEEFNKNVYDIILATDEHEIIADDAHDDQTDAEADKGTGGDDNDRAENSSSRSTKRARIEKRDKEYGVARGIDFKNVACVINFDLPTSSKSYTHRIGRTARAGKTGMALSFVIPKDKYRKHKSTSIQSTEHDEEVLSKIVRHQRKKGHEVKPYQFDMNRLDAFRYRLTDALRAVTRTAVREARTRELKQELLKSDKLRRHFEENPDDLHHLRHDSDSRAARVQPHLKHVPSYLLPASSRKALMEGDVGFVGLHKDQARIRNSRAFKGKGKFKRTGVKKHADPLKTFNSKSRR